MSGAAELPAEADAFAVRWLESSGGSRRDLIAVLQAMERQKISNLFHREASLGLGVARWETGDWLPLRLRESLDRTSRQPLLQRAVTNWRLMEHIVIHSDLATYSYASFSDRVRMIQQLPRQAAS